METDRFRAAEEVAGVASQGRRPRLLTIGTML